MSVWGEGFSSSGNVRQVINGLKNACESFRNKNLHVSVTVLYGKLGASARYTGIEEGWRFCGCSMFTFALFASR